MKLERLVNEVFFYQNMCLINTPKLFPAATIAAADKLAKKRRIFVN
jgi:hypothetical protein